MKWYFYIIIFFTVITPNCEYLALAIQEDNGGDLVFIQPLKPNGAYDLGRHNGHWINYFYSQDYGYVYFDGASQNFMSSKKDVLIWYGRPAQIFNFYLGERPPFSLIRS
jgi:hypothetical protein